MSFYQLEDVIQSDNLKPFMEKDNCYDLVKEFLPLFGDATVRSIYKPEILWLQIQLKLFYGGADTRCYDCNTSAAKQQGRCGYYQGEVCPIY